MGRCLDGIWYMPPLLVWPLRRGLLDSSEPQLPTASECWGCWGLFSWGDRAPSQRRVNVLAECLSWVGVSEVALLGVCLCCKWVLFTQLPRGSTGAPRLVLSLRREARPETGLHRLLHLSLEALHSGLIFCQCLLLELWGQQGPLPSSGGATCPLSLPWTVEQGDAWFFQSSQEMRVGCGV